MHLIVFKRVVCVSNRLHWNRIAGIDPEGKDLIRAKVIEPGNPIPNYLAVRPRIDRDPGLCIRIKRAQSLNRVPLDYKVDSKGARMGRGGGIGSDDLKRKLIVVEGIL